jgi:hypothetical protein
MPNRQTLRPRDLALLLLASGDLRPRQRARDQQADVAGLEIKRRILQKLAEMDPEPEELDSVLFKTVDEFGPPFGPTRAVAAIVRDEWHTACAEPEWVSQLLSEAVHHSGDRRETPTKGNKENRA